MTEVHLNARICIERKAVRIGYNIGMLSRNVKVEQDKIKSHSKMHGGEKAVMHQKTLKMQLYWHQEQLLREDP